MVTTPVPKTSADQDPGPVTSAVASAVTVVFTPPAVASSPWPFEKDFTTTWVSPSARRNTTLWSPSLTIVAPDGSRATSVMTPVASRVSETVRPEPSTGSTEVTWVTGGTGVVVLLVSSVASAWAMPGSAASRANTRPARSGLDRPLIVNIASPSLGAFYWRSHNRSV